MVYRSWLTTTASVAVPTRRGAPWVLAAAVVLSPGLAPGQAQQAPFVVTAADADRVPAPFLVTEADIADMDPVLVNGATLTASLEVTADKTARTAVFDGLSPAASERFGDVKPFDLFEEVRVAGVFAVTREDVEIALAGSGAREDVAAPQRADEEREARLSRRSDLASSMDRSGRLALSDEAITARLSAAGIEADTLASIETGSAGIGPISGYAFQSRHGAAAGPVLSFEQWSGGFAFQSQGVLDGQNPSDEPASAPSLVAELSQTG